MTGSPAAPDATRDYNFNPLGLLRLLLTHWRWVFGLPFGAAILATVLSFAVPPGFRARARFVADVRRSGGFPSDLAGLASRFGVAIPGSDPTRSPRFFADLIAGRPVLTSVVTHRYSVGPGNGDSDDSLNLLDLLHVSPRLRPDLRLERGVMRLRQLTSVSVDRETGVVTVEVDMPSPSLAAAVVDGMLRALADYNLRNRQSQARARRMFVDARVEGADTVLRSAEDVLRRFYQENRQWESSPTLRFEEARARRRVDVAQEVFLSLRREQEMARIAEVDDTPVINVIEAPLPPARKATPRRVQWAWIAALTTGLLVVAALGAWHSRNHWRAIDPDSYDWWEGLTSRRADRAP